MQNRKQITLKQLRSLNAISEFGSFTRAAEYLNLTPPAITVQIKSLETALSSKVLVRSKDGKNSLTAIGLESIKLAQQIETNVTNFFSIINSIKKGKFGSVNLGVVSTGKYFAPWIVANAKIEMPNIDVELFIGNRHEVITALDQNKVDLAIMSRPPRAPMVRSEVLGDNPHVFIGPRDHGLSIKKISTGVEVRKALESETIIVREPGSGTRILLDRFLNQFSEERTFKYKEMASNETMKQAVMAGLGVALISSSTIESELTDGRLSIIPMPGLPIIRQWFIVHREQLSLNTATQRFKEFLLSRKGNILSPKLNRKNSVK